MSEEYKQELGKLDWSLLDWDTIRNINLLGFGSISTLDKLISNIEKDFNIQSIAFAINATFNLINSTIRYINHSHWEGVVRVRAFGTSTKYHRDGWKQVSKADYLNPIKRHFVAIQKGELIDKESGEHHGYHIICNLYFMYCLLTNMV